MRFSAAEALDASHVDRNLLRATLPDVDPSAVPVYAASRWFRMLWAPNITAVAMPWGIYVHPDRLAVPLSALGPLMVHELTHLQQWRLLGPLRWARVYFGEYLRGRRSGLAHHAAYRAISLEVEARDVAERITAG
ncbi:MAG: hypothetical protein V1757_00495 [Actinomycetota bacterium]